MPHIYFLFNLLHTYVRRYLKNDKKESINFKIVWRIDLEAPR